MAITDLIPEKKKTLRVKCIVNTSTEQKPLLLMFNTMEEVLLKVFKKIKEIEIKRGI